MPRDAELTEVGVTPELAAAGAKAFRFNERFEDLGEALERAYRAIWALRP